MLKPLTMQGRLSCGLPEAVAGKVWAFTAVMGKAKGEGWCLGVAIANEPGYYPISSFWASSDSYDEMSKHADELNRAEGLDDKQAVRIVCSTMRTVPKKEPGFTEPQEVVFQAASKVLERCGNLVEKLPQSARESLDELSESLIGVCR